MSGLEWWKLPSSSPGAELMTPIKQSLNYNTVQIGRWLPLTSMKFYNFIYNKGWRKEMWNNNQILLLLTSWRKKQFYCKYDGKTSMFHFNIPDCDHIDITLQLSLKARWQVFHFPKGPDHLSEAHPHPIQSTMGSLFPDSKSDHSPHSLLYVPHALSPNLCIFLI